MKQLLVCTDLDRTLIPNGMQAESPDALGLFKRLVSRREITLAYVTGRHHALIEQAINDFNLPQPDYAIADVGTTIYRVASEGWQRWETWEEQIAPDWRGLSHDGICSLLREFSQLHMQEKEKQNRYKLSFYAPSDTDTQALTEKMGAQLKNAGIKANLVWSIDEKKNLGLLDVLPASANKLHAIHFLMQQKGFSLEGSVFAGDSGNDLDVLLSDIPSVLVANADNEIKIHAAKSKKDALYIAKGGFLGMNGNYSAGIIEGIAHYWPEADVWLREMCENRG